MAIEVACVKCKLPVTVTTEALKELTELGGRAQITHEVCPTEVPESLREFHVVISVFEVTRDADEPERASEEQVAGVGATVHAPSFRDAYEPLGVALGEQWGIVARSVDFIDTPVTKTPQVKQDVPAQDEEK